MHESKKVTDNLQKNDQCLRDTLHIGRFDSDSSHIPKSYSKSRAVMVGKIG